MESANNGLNPKADLQYLIVNSISDMYTQQISTQQNFPQIDFCKCYRPTYNTVSKSNLSFWCLAFNWVSVIISIIVLFN